MTIWKQISTLIAIVKGNKGILSNVDSFGNKVYFLNMIDKYRIVILLKNFEVLVKEFNDFHDANLYWNKEVKLKQIK